MARRRRTHGPHDYPRTARLNELVRQIVADEIERTADDRLELATVVAVEVEPDLHHAVVHVASLEGAAGDARLVEALTEHRAELQAAIGRQARLRRVPELEFRPDEVTRRAERIDDILRDLAGRDDRSADSDDTGDPAEPVDDSGPGAVADGGD